MTQEEMVLNHLKGHGTITSMEAFSKYKITRISEYIRQLREKDGKRRYEVYTLHESRR